MHQTKWLQAGNADQPALLLLHGFLGAGTDWDTLLPALSQHYFCLAPDLPGHGHNPQHDCDFEASIVQLLAQLDSRGIQAFNLLGYSLGARLALYLLCRHPMRVKACLLESGSPGLADPDQRQTRIQRDEALARRLETEPLEDFLTNWYAQPLFTGLRASPGFGELFARRLRNKPLQLARSLRQAGTGVAPNLWPQLPDIRQPLGYLAGAQDQKFTAIGQAMAQACPHLQFTGLQGGHCLHHEAPQAWTTAVLEFFKVSTTTETSLL